MTPRRPKRQAPARPPAADKLRRWIDLLAALLRRSTIATFDELARDVPAYASRGHRDPSLMRQFERDKDELRALGVPIETVIAADSETTGYRLRRNRFYLPYLQVLGAAHAPKRAPAWGYGGLESLSFLPDEIDALLSAARRAAQLGSKPLADDARAAARKLAFDLPGFAAAGNEPEPVHAPEREADGALFETIMDAVRRRKRLTFDYHAIEQDRSAPREVEPYGLFFLSGHWYLAGRDLARAAIRNFRLSRIRDAAVRGAQAQTPDFEVPGDFDLRLHARARHPWELGESQDLEAVVECDEGTTRALDAAKLGVAVGGDPTRRRFSVRRPEVFARWLLSFAGGARPVSPPAVVDAWRDLARQTLTVYSRERR